MALMGMVMAMVRIKVKVKVKVRVKVRVKGKAMAMAMAMATVEYPESGCSSRLVLRGRRLDRQNVSLTCIEGWEAGGFDG
jgi:hypothetical protein